MTSPGRPPVIDAHQHFIDRARVPISWMQPGSPIYDDWLPGDLKPDLEQLGVDATIAVQADNHYSDTDHMLRLAEEHDWIAGVVGWAPLDQPEATRERLELHRREHPKFRGVRHLLHLESDPDWVLQDAVIESLRLLAEHGLVFEISVTDEAYLPHVPVLAERVPALQFVIPHMGFPKIAEGGWEPWASDLARAAEHPQVAVKLSALELRADRRRWKPSDLQRYVDHALERFGPERMMWASNWPVSLMGGDYERLFRGHTETLRALGDEERAQVLGGTVARVYQLDLGS